MPRSPRSVRVRSDCIAKVQTRLNGEFLSQATLAERLGFSQSTISKFLGGKPVDRQFFIEICSALGIDNWSKIATSSQYELAQPVFSISPPSGSDNEVIEEPTGQVPLSSLLYLGRPPIETTCYQAIARPYALIRIKAPRQMGKSSLMRRILDAAAQHGNEIVYLSLEQATQDHFKNVDHLMQWFCASIAYKTNQLFNRTKFEELTLILGSNQGAQIYLETELLPALGTPLTIGLDDVDRVFKFPLYSDFFSFLRSLHELSKNNAVLKQLRFVLAHSTEVYVPINVNQSPFNVGMTIQLPEFTPEQVQELAQRHQLTWSLSQVETLMALMGGHPYLIRLALYHIVVQGQTITSIIQTALTEQSIYREHLRRLDTILAEQPDLRTAMQNVMRIEAASVKPILTYKLEALGLVKLHNGRAMPCCELYRHYFQVADKT